MLRARPLALLVAAWAAGCVAQPAALAEEASVKPGINEDYLAPELEVERCIERFECESREIARATEAIVAFCGVRPGDVVADVGAGTGLFEPLFERLVGPAGRVLAVDLSPMLLAHLARRKEQEGWERVEVVACTERSIGLPIRTADVVFLCDTYHHFEYPRSTLASIRRALKPGGLLVVVDFERVEGVSSEWLLNHVRAGREVFQAEIEAAGFRFVDAPAVPGLRENYLLRFRR